MAVKQAVCTHGDGTIPAKSYKIFWENLACGDTGSPESLPAACTVRTVQVTGTFNSETVTMQGSNDGTNYFALSDAATGTAGDCTFTAAGGKAILECPLYIRPSFSGSSGGDVDVTLFAM